MVVASGPRRRLFRRRPVLQACQQASQPLLDPLALVAVQLVLHRGITGQLRQQPVTGSHLSQMQFRFDADPFEGLQLVGRERVVQIFGHGVGVFRETAAFRFRGTDRGPADRRTDAVHEVRRHHAGRNLRPQLLLFAVGKDTVQPGQQGSECETHGSCSGPPSRIEGRMGSFI